MSTSTFPITRACLTRRFVPPLLDGQLRRTFGLCNNTSLDDESARVMFAGDGVVMLPIQGNDPACNDTLCNIKAVCGIMTDKDKGSEASEPSKTSYDTTAAA